MSKAIIVLDRDGVINYDSDDYVKSVEEWIPLPRSMEAIGQLSKAGYEIAIATNQSGIARGYFDLDTLNAMHQKMVDLASEHGGTIQYIHFCPHGPDDHCDCRKPKAGLIDQIERKVNQTIAGSYMVGDSLRDLEAGVSKGLKPVLVLTGKGQRTLDKGVDLEDLQVFDDLMAFSEWLISSKHETTS